MQLNTPVSMKTESEQVATTESHTFTGPQTVPGRSHLSALARDITMIGSGTALAALFNTVLVFLIPRVINVEDFGYWRLFLLYAGYAGLLHMGFLDGLLLRWAGQQISHFHSELHRSLTFLLWQMLVILLPASVIMALALHGHARFIGVSVLMYAAVFNANALLQYALQGARQFKPVAVASVIPVAVFVVVVLLWGMRLELSYRVLILLYCASWAVALVYLWWQVRPSRPNEPKSLWALGKTSILLGCPILMANVGQGLLQSADRLVVSSVLPIFQFAQYALASSVLFVPVTAITAVYRVFFSHAAALGHQGRTKLYAHASRFLAILWSLLLPYFFALDVFVRSFLPKYSPAMPISAILLLGVLFLAEIQILHTSFAYLYGRQRQFLELTFLMLGLSFAGSYLAAKALQSLKAVAIAQVLVLLVCWLINESTMRKITGQRWRDHVRILSLFGWSSLCYGIVLRYTDGAVIRSLIYYALVAGYLAIMCYPDFRTVARLLINPQLGTALLTRSDS